MPWWRQTDDDDKPNGSSAERAALMAEIAAEAAYTAEWTGRARFAPRVMAAMAAVPRDAFVAESDRSCAWINRPLPIGHRQTISQPFIVALMTDLIDPEPDDVVLEIGTGSGYQAAILSRLVRMVYSIERVPALAESAAARLTRLGYDNVVVRAGDGAAGWPENGPFDGIIVTAAAESPPAALIAQLKPGAALVVPVGKSGSQQLKVIRRSADGRSESRDVLPVAFVPLLTGTGG